MLLDSKLTNINIEKKSGRPNFKAFFWFATMFGNENDKSLDFMVIFQNKTLSSSKLEKSSLALVYSYKCVAKYMQREWSLQTLKMSTFSRFII